MISRSSGTPRNLSAIVRGAVAGPAREILAPCSPAAPQVHVRHRGRHTHHVGTLAAHCCPRDRRRGVSGRTTTTTPQRRRRPPAVNPLQLPRTRRSDERRADDVRDASDDVRRARRIHLCRRRRQRHRRRDVRALATAPPGGSRGLARCCRPGLVPHKPLRRAPSWVCRRRRERGRRPMGWLTPMPAFRWRSGCTLASVR